MVGIGYRKDFAEDFAQKNDFRPDFIEVAPENWMNVGGYYKKMFDRALEQFPLFCHGLSLSVGSPEGIDPDFVKQLKKFLDDNKAVVYSEHLSFSKCDNAHLYDLLPIPFTEDAVKHVAKNIRQAQDILERKIAIEIVSYYSPLALEMTEIDFVNAVISEADCDLLLDVNNIYVNGFNHQYEPSSFLKKLDLLKVRYIHMAGHTQVNENLIIDTHAEAIIDPVYELFTQVLSLINRDVPILLERDFNIPELEDLQFEMKRLEAIKKSMLIMDQNVI